MRPFSPYLYSLIHETPVCAVNLSGSTPPYLGPDGLFDKIKIDLRPEGQVEQLNQFQLKMSQKIRCSENEIHPAVGSSLVYTQSLATLTEPGDSILIEKPTYDPFVECARLLKLKIKFFKRSGEEDQDFREIKKSSRAVKVIVISNPHCPTGQVYSQAMLSRVSALGKYFIVDEVFNPLFSNGELTQLPGDLAKNVMTIGSFSKSVGLAGLRLGWLRAHPELCAKFEKIGYNFHIKVPVPSLMFASHALESWTKMIEPNLELEKKARPVLNDFFRNHKDVLSHDFKRGYFAVLRVPKNFKDGDTFAKAVLAKTNIWLRPGKLFFMPKHVRFHCLVANFNEVFTKVAEFY